MADEDGTSQRPTAVNRLPFPPNPVIEAYKKDVDRTLIRDHLKLTVPERFWKLQSFMRLVEGGRKVKDASRTKATYTSSCRCPPRNMACHLK